MYLSGTVGACQETAISGKHLLESTIVSGFSDYIWDGSPDGMELDGWGSDHKEQAYSILYNKQRFFYSRFNRHYHHY